jgi:hypothetical protein
MREGVFGSARAQLREVAVEVLANALDALETQAAKARVPAHASRSTERTREVLERDRALASSGATALAPIRVAAPIRTSATAPGPEPTPARAPVPAHMPAPTPSPAPTDVECDEPIRTRSMAKLLAAQGHPARALAIYRYLLAQSEGDAALEAEIVRLEQQPSAPAEASAR